MSRATSASRDGNARSSTLIGVSLSSSSRFASESSASPSPSLSSFSSYSLLVVVVVVAHLYLLDSARTVRSSAADCLLVHARVLSPRPSRKAWPSRALRRELGEAATTTRNTLATPHHQRRITTEVRTRILLEILLGRGGFELGTLSNYVTSIFTACESTHF